MGHPLSPRPGMCKAASEARPHLRGGLLLWAKWDDKRGLADLPATVPIPYILPDDFG